MRTDPKNNISFFPERARNIVLDFSLNELTAIIHALEENYDKIRTFGGDRYGMLSIEELLMMIDRLHRIHPDLLIAVAH